MMRNWGGKSLPPPPPRRQKTHRGAAHYKHWLELRGEADHALDLDAALDANFDRVARALHELAVVDLLPQELPGVLVVWENKNICV